MTTPARPGRDAVKTPQPNRDSVRMIRDVPLQEGDWAVECSNPGWFLKVHPSEFGKPASNPAYSYFREQQPAPAAVKGEPVRLWFHKNGGIMDRTPIVLGWPANPRYFIECDSTGTPLPAPETSAGEPTEDDFPEERKATAKYFEGLTQPAESGAREWEALADLLNDFDLALLKRGFSADSELRAAVCAVNNAAVAIDDGREVQGRGWRPIESAPLDGSRVWLTDGKNRWIAFLDKSNPYGGNSPFWASCMLWTMGCGDPVAWHPIVLPPPPAGEGRV